MGNIQFINAGAGSGKTTTLTKKFCEHLAKNNAKPSEFILTTYTKAAADEFRSRIKARLVEENMNEFLPLVESAHIGTIHSVAQTFIEKYWYLLDMSPALSVREDDEMAAFRSRILDSVVSGDDLLFFYNYASNLDVRKMSDGVIMLDPDFWREMVLDLVDKMRLYGFEKKVLDEFRQASVEVIEEVYPVYPLDKDAVNSAAGELLSYFEGLTKVKDSAMKAWDNVFLPFLKKQSWETCLPVLQFFEKTEKWVQGAPRDMYEIVEKYAVSCVRNNVLECAKRIFAISEKLFDKIADYKRAEGILEFSDLEILFLELLSYDSVRSDLRDSVKYVFVDEFQDVSPIQLKIFRTLGEIVDESCWVGDPKQAIYGFRGSDSSLVNSVIASMKGGVVNLGYSRRSLPQLVNASNNIFIRAFGLLTASESLEEERVRLEPWEKKIAEENALDSYRGVHHWWLSLPTKTGQSSDMKKAKEVYPAVASRLWRIFNDNEFKVTDTVDDKPKVRSLRYGDVAILTRRNDECIDIAGALRAKGLPVSVLDARMKNQAEIRLVISLMKYIAGIDSNLTVAELRRLLQDDDLETILSGLAKQNDFSDLVQLLDCIKELYQHHSVYDMVRELVALLDLRHMVGKWSMIQKRQTNLDMLVSMASTFVQRQKEASVQEFIYYIADKEVDVPFDNTGNTIKVLSYHKSKGLQWKMVIMNSLYKDSLEEKDFMKKDFSRLIVRTTPAGKVGFVVFPPVDKIQTIVIERVKAAEKASELWNYLREKKRAEDLRLLYVGFTRAENYLVMLSFGAVPMKWLSNTEAILEQTLQKDEICDDPTLSKPLSEKVHMLPCDKVLTRTEGKRKFVSPSQCEPDPAADVPQVELDRIAENIDVARWNVDADVFGTCIHNYMAVHKWSSEGKYGAQNLKNAERVLSGFGFDEIIAAESLVKQADAFFAYIEKKYGEVVAAEHEIPFTNRKDGQVISGEIDLYVKADSGKGILVDFKNPQTQLKGEQSLDAKALKYWPQLDMYRDALRSCGYPVDQVCIYYPLLGVVARYKL